MTDRTRRGIIRFPAADVIRSLDLDGPANPDVVHMAYRPERDALDVFIRSASLPATPEAALLDEAPVVAVGRGLHPYTAKLEQQLAAVRTWADTHETAIPPELSAELDVILSNVGGRP